jgi:hypothetical protein
MSQPLLIFLVVAKAIEYIILPLYFFTQQKMLFANQDQIKDKLDSISNTEMIEVVQNSGTSDHIIEIKQLLYSINMNQLDMTNNQSKTISSNNSTQVDENDFPNDENL